MKRLSEALVWGGVTVGCALFLGVFVQVAINVANGSIFPALLTSCAFFAAAWIVGKIADRKNNGDE